MGSSFNDGKADGAMRTIGEVAKAIGVKAHVLRYWEQQFPMLKPLKRSGGRRYYRSEDVELVERIHSLVNDDGYTLKGARKVLENDKSANGKSANGKSANGKSDSGGAKGREAKASSATAIKPTEDDISSDGGVSSFFGSDMSSEASSGEQTASDQQDAAEAEYRLSSGPSKKEIVSRLKAIRSNLEEATDA